MMFSISSMRPTTPAGTYSISCSKRAGTHFIPNSPATLPTIIRSSRVTRASSRAKVLVPINTLLGSDNIQGITRRPSLQDVLIHGHGSTRFLYALLRAEEGYRHNLYPSSLMQIYFLIVFLMYFSMASTVNPKCSATSAPGPLAPKRLRS
jgi:hypothetical protein